MLSELNNFHPTYVFLSSEPFPFKEKHVKEIQNYFPNSKIKITNMKGMNLTKFTVSAAVSVPSMNVPVDWTVSNYSSQVFHPVKDVSLNNGNSIVIVMPPLLNGKNIPGYGDAPYSFQYFIFADQNTGFQSFITLNQRYNNPMAYFDSIPSGIALSIMVE
jgi:hypothetical protein